MSAFKLSLVKNAFPLLYQVPELPAAACCTRASAGSDNKAQDGFTFSFCDFCLKPLTDAMTKTKFGNKHTSGLSQDVSVWV